MDEPTGRCADAAARSYTALDLQRERAIGDSVLGHRGPV
jgi:hypothetical protein